MGKAALPVMERLLANHAKVASGCWNWTRSTFPNGYGCLSVRGKSTGAHVASYTEFKGVIPKGMMVRHACHNKLCINPDHLLVGTGLDNADDERRAGKLATGEKNARFIDIPGLAARINDLRKGGMRRADILAEVGISSGKYARMVLRGELDMKVNKAARSHNCRVGGAPTQFKKGRV